MAINMFAGVLGLYLNSILGVSTIIVGDDEDNYEVQDRNVMELDGKGIHINQSGNMDID